MPAKMQYSLFQLPKGHMVPHCSHSWNLAHTLPLSFVFTQGIVIAQKPPIVNGFYFIYKINLHSALDEKQKKSKIVIKKSKKEVKAMMGIYKLSPFGGIAGGVTFSDSEDRK